MGGQNARVSKHSAAGRVGGEEAREEAREEGGGGGGEERRVHIKTRTHQQESGGNKIPRTLLEVFGI